MAAQGALDERLAGLSDDDARRPSQLPGWTVGHVLTHIARNADSVVWRLEGAAGASCATSTPGGWNSGGAEIEAGAARPAADLVADVRHSSAAVAAAMEALPAARVGRPVAHVARCRRALARRRALALA